MTEHTEHKNGERKGEEAMGCWLNKKADRNVNSKQIRNKKMEQNVNPMYSTSGWIGDLNSENEKTTERKTREMLKIR